MTPMEMTCVDCGQSDQTTLSIQLDKGGRLVRFRVDCVACGGFSHYLTHDERNRAFRRFLEPLTEVFDKWSKMGGSRPTDAEYKAAVLKLFGFAELEDGRTLNLRNC